MQIYRRGSEFVFEVAFPEVDGTLIDMGPIDMQVYYYESSIKVLLDESTVSVDEENLYKYEIADTSGFPVGVNVIVWVNSPVGQRREDVYVITETGEFGASGLSRVNVRFTE